MKNFLIGLIVGVVLSGLGILIFIFAAIRFAGSFAERPVTVADGSTIELKLDGDVPEKSPPEIPLPFLEQQNPITVEEVWDLLRKAASDSRVKGILFEPRGLDIGWAKMQEVRDDILQFRKSGKPIITFLQTPTAREYYLATATDRIYISPEDSLDLKGLAATSIFLKSTLDKVGVKFDVIHAGKYKDAGDILTQTSMSPETREVLNDVLDQYYGNLIAVIAQGRKQSPDTVRATIDNGPYDAKEALSKGLVDQLAYEDQAVGDMQNRLKQTSLKRVSGKAYLKALPAPASGARRIALIVGQGDITEGSGNESASDPGFTATAFIKLLKQVEDDSSISGVIMRIDSPGGDAVASDDMLHAAKNLAQKKPLVISMSDLAASGGYYVSSTGNPIVAYPNTLTGSIGVIFARMNLHALFDKIGVNEQLLTRGRFADIDSNYAPLTKDEQEKLTSEIDAFYRAFVGRVAEGRKKSFDQIEPLAQGRVWLGAQAKQNGLVDDLGGIDRAIEVLRPQAHIGPNETITLVPYPGRRSIFDYLFNRSDESAEIETKLGKTLGGLPVHALVKGGFLKLLPYSIVVR